MTIVADRYQYVVGVDTHALHHSYAIITAVTGTLIAQRSFPTTATGLSRAADWIARRTQAHIAGTLISAEGTGSYGARAARLLTKLGYRVVEAPTPDPGRIRGKGKSDPADALTAARSTMSTELNSLRDRRTDGPRAAAQALVTRRDQLTRLRTAEINRLTALLRTHDLGIDARCRVTTAQIRQIAAWRPRAEDHDQALLRQIAIDHATEILRLAQRLQDNATQLATHVDQHHPELLTLYGVGPVNAAVIWSVWSHPGRIRTARAWTKIAGTSPIPVHSGNTHRYRLSRGGDRRLNSTIHQIMLNRCRTQDTKDYITNRTTHGKTEADARRALKNYIARQVFRTLNQAHPQPAPEPRPLLTAA